MPTHLLTGATGFVGSAIALELLQQGAERVVGIVRPHPEMSAVARLRATLHGLITQYALPESLHDAVDSRVEAAEGDVQAPRCGVVRDDLKGAEIWHCAASLQYQDRHKDLIFATNVEGTRQAVALASMVDASRFNSVSTAYVAGNQRGSILEVPGDPERVNNHYEHSKIVAETVAAQSAIPTRILRPSIVVGHSHTHHALNFNGLYGFLRGITKFVSSLERAQPGLSATLQVRMRVDPEAGLNLVPVNHIAQQAVALSRADAPAGTYHLTNATPPPVGRCIEGIFDLMGMKRPIFVDDIDQLGALDKKLRQGLEFYQSYLVHPKRFSRDCSDAVLGAYPGFDLPPERFLDFCQWYLDTLEATHRPLPATR